MYFTKKLKNLVCLHGTNFIMLPLLYLKDFVTENTTQIQLS